MTKTIIEWTIEGSAAGVRRCLENGMPIDSQNEEGNTALFYATAEGHMEIICILLERGCRLDISNKYGSTPLHEAARLARHQIFDTLIQAGADIHARDENDWAVIHYAVSSQDTKIVNAVLEKAGQMSLVATTKEGYTPLHIAASCCNMEMVNFLLQNGATFDMTDNQGRTALSFISVSDAPAPVEFPSLALRASGVCAALKTMINKQDFSDVTFSVQQDNADPVTIYGHKAIICSRSEHLNTLIDQYSSTASFMNEVNSPVIITGIQPASFLAILEYLYTGTIDRFWMADGLSAPYEGSRMSRMVQTEEDTYQCMLLALDLHVQSETFMLEDLRQLCERVLMFVVRPRQHTPILEMSPIIQASVRDEEPPSPFVKFCATYVMLNYNLIIDIPELKRALLFASGVLDASMLISRVNVDTARGMKWLKPASTVQWTSQQSLMTGKNLKTALSIFNKSTKDPKAMYFSEPVDPKKIHAPLYFETIRFPMDFGTIKDKFDKKLYRTVEEWIHDMQLVFSNAVLYNPKEHEVHKTANHLSGLFEGRLRNVSWEVATKTEQVKSLKEKRRKEKRKPLEPVHVPISKPQPFTVEERMHLAKTVIGLSSDLLYRSLEILNAGHTVQMMDDDDQPIGEVPVDTVDVDFGQVSDITLKKLESMFKKNVPNYQPLPKDNTSVPTTSIPVGDPMIEI
ncbi:hypothetical protein PROFUN_09270 [Planoprotostelium fungivorum]|uniref:Ankyrin repeat protein n=1 Tax=Planoprotostelium fungivorum TaxID=1890364 RepID=A0A2P6NKW1_9EUKA|nr:hypothetical protein PROFUN_09270 [Planoprotostelium fungivorum]